MIPRECKRLAEVDFPIAEVSRHSAREKSIRHGHPSTLHLWWARRPLAACRAMLLALLLPDPGDALCPAEFKAQARALLPRLVGQIGPEDLALRQALLRFIGDFANWDNAAHPVYLEVGRGLVKAAHPEETPLVVDPFAGGGSIPLEALRLGCEAFASDLNPVACLILKVMLEDIPRHGPELAEELRRVGGQIKRQAERELAEFYPPDPDGARPIAYLWARTVRCEAPNCGAEIPLMRSCWLSKKAKRRRALRCKVVRPTGQVPRVEFEIFEPKGEAEVPKGTVTRAKATCPCCNVVLAPERVRAQLAAQRGGADATFDAKGHRLGGARLLAVVTLRDGEPGRHYRLTTERDYNAGLGAQKRLARIVSEWERGDRNTLCPVPDEPISLNEIRRISLPIYGMKNWGDPFTARQKVALITLTSSLRGRTTGTNDSLCEFVAMVLGRFADYNSSGASWAQSGEFVRSTFGRQALPIVWDFVEAVPWSDSSGNLDGAIDWAARVASAWPGSTQGQVQIADAANHPLPDASADVWFTDPPYYDSVPYAHLADFFLVWAKRALPDHPFLRDPFDPTNALTPKKREIVVDRPHKLSNSTKDADSYKRGMAHAFAEGRRALKENGVGSVVFAHKSTEGWEALLSGLIRGGWTITGSWPIATERSARLNAQETAALATSVHLICRPRLDGGTGDWANVLRELPTRVGDWMERLQGEGVRGADLVFACIGPALEIFSRYARVETAEGRAVGLPEYLEKVWEVVGRMALEQVLGTAEAQARNGGAGALEEDARLTALFLWTLQSTAGAAASNANEGEDEADEGDDDEEASRRKPKGYSLVFDVARRFAQPLGIHLPLWEGRIIETDKGVVRLLAVSERARQLFGQEGARAVAARLERSGGQTPQLSLLPEDDETPRVRGRRAKGAVPGAPVQAPREATTLDRVHAAMLLQSGGQTHGLRALLKAEQERGTEFLRLANALSALYPRGSEEKRLLDAMLLAVPR